MAKRDETREAWLAPDGLLRVEGWAREGLTDEQIADNMGICRSTFYEWQKRHRAFALAVKRGKAPVDVQVENALLKSALGYTQTVKKAVRSAEGYYCYVDEEVYFPPQTAAQIFWLKNRRPDRWRDKPAPETPREESIVDRLTRELIGIQSAKSDETNT